MLKNTDTKRLKVLERYWLSNHVMPLYSEMMRFFSLSRGGVSKFMNRLEEEGVIKKHGSSFRPCLITDSSGNTYRTSKRLRCVRFLV
jgi:hypothetical protein